MGWLRDIRWAARGWARDRGFATVAVMVLGVGIGLTTATVALTRAYLLRPLPFPGAERVYTVRPVPEGGDFSMIPAGFNDVEWGSLSEIAEEVGRWDLDAFSVLGEGGAERVRGAWVTPSLLRLVGARAALGRLLTERDVRSGAQVAVIGHDLWQRRFGGTPEVLGRTIRTFSSDRPEDAEVFEVVGVLPEGFWHLNDFTEVLVPLTEDRTPYLVRLRTGVSPAAAAERLTGVVRSQVSDTDPAWRMTLISTHEAYVASVRPTLLLILGAAGLVLLVACGNVGILTLVRATRREREFLIRRALGAGRGRIVRSMLAEGVLLATVSAVVGTVLGAAGLAVAGPLVETRLGVRVPGGTGALGLDPAVLLAVAGLALFVAVFFGVLPVLAGRTELAGALAERARGAEPRSRRRLRAALVAAEVAVSLSLLIAAGQVVRSALNVHGLALGFEPRGAMVASIQLRQRSYPEDRARNALYDGIRTRVAALPGVEAVGITSAAPFTYTFGPTPVERTGGDDPVGAAVHASGPGYDRALGLRLRAGRWFETSDGPDAEPVAVVSEGLALRLWPERDPLGATVRVRSADADTTALYEWRRVVGVVEDVRKTFTEAHHPDLYVPTGQVTPASPDLVVRAATDPLALVPAIRRIVAELDGTVPVSNPRPMTAVLDDHTAGPDFLAKLIGAFSALTVALAVIGLYGVIAYAVGQRRRDVAVRMALGAEPAQVVDLFVRRGAMLMTAGLAVGVVGGYALSRAIASQLHGVSTGDVSTYVGLTLIFGAVGVAAMWLPARAASRTEPARVLREE
jgi:putative ABC transport system permease protein